MIVYFENTIFVSKSIIFTNYFFISLLNSMNFVYPSQSASVPTQPQVISTTQPQVISTPQMQQLTSSIPTQPQIISTPQMQQLTSSIPTQPQVTSSIPGISGISTSKLPPVTQIGQNGNSIFTNASGISNSNITFAKVATSAPKSIKPPTKPRSTHPPAAKTKVTETFDIDSSSYGSYNNYVKLSQPMYPYNEPLMSPYYGSCPLESNLICLPKSSTNLLYFDNLLLSVKLTEFKDEAAKIYQVSLQDLKKYYSFNSKSMLAFKAHFKIPANEAYKRYSIYCEQLKTTCAEYVKNKEKDPNPQNIQGWEVAIQKLNEQINYINKELEKLQKSISTTSKEDSIVIYNTNTYPITDKSGKWLTISYLIPFLMFASPLFINHTSNLLMHLLLAKSYNPTIATTPQGTIALNDYLNVIPQQVYITQQLPDPKFKLRITPKDQSANQNAVPGNPQAVKEEPIHKLIIQTPKPIIPRLNDPTNPRSTTTFNAFVTPEITAMFNSSQYSLEKLQAFYTSLSQISKLCNPADMLCVNAFAKLKSLSPQISIVKVYPSQCDANGKINDVKILKKLKGIKEKKVKTKDSKTEEIDSQETYTYEEAIIDPKATLQNIYKYAIYLKQIQMTPEQLKTIKTKIEGDKNLFDFMLALTQNADVTQLNQLGQQEIVTYGFKNWLASQKKSNSGNKRKTAATITADVGFTEDESVSEVENGNIDESDQENMDEYVEDVGNGEEGDEYGEAEYIPEVN